MEKFARYLKSGAIDAIVQAPKKAISTQDMVPCDDAVSDTTHYVDLKTTTVKPKLKQDIQVKRQGMSVNLNGLAEGTLVSVDGQALTAGRDAFEIEFELPGTYIIYLSDKVEYLDQALEVTID